MEVVIGEAVVLALDHFPHRHMRLDVLFFDHPDQHVGSAVDGVAGEAFWCEVELRFDTFDHRPGRIYFGSTTQSDPGANQGRACCRTGKRKYANTMTASELEATQLLAARKDTKLAPNVSGLASQPA